MIPEGLRRSQPLLLASRSPQRRAILTMLGVEFEAVTPGYDEPDLPGAPEEIAVAHARGKAASVEGERVLGVDTIVVIEGRVLGKPPGVPEARGGATVFDMATTFGARDPATLPNACGRYASLLKSCNEFGSCRAICSFQTSTNAGRRCYGSALCATSTTSI